MGLERRWWLSVSLAMIPLTPLALADSPTGESGEEPVEAVDEVPVDDAPMDEAPVEEAEPMAEETVDEGPAMTAPVPADSDAATLWKDFNHYVRIARPDLAEAAATALTGQVDDQALLDIVEASDYTDYERTLERARRIESLRGTADTISGKIQSARIARSREPQRIAADIAKLAEGARANLNATARLKAAGQYAAPQLLATLVDDRQARLHPYVMQTMVAIGRPMVYPLSVALPDLEPVPQGQVAQVLAEIGYPRAAAAIKDVLEDTKTDPTTRAVAEAAFRQLSNTAGIPGGVAASELYLTLAENLYVVGTEGRPIPGYETADGQGIVWQFDKTAGLIAIPVPGPIFADVLAMRAARRGLTLNPQMDPALSLWLMANLRRENRLPEGASDPSYGSAMQPAIYYVEMAGPLRQHDILARALRDNDPALALDAITALANTAGTDALVNREGTVQPLLNALSYPDRRVRFHAAFALTNAHPSAEFPGSHRVVPVLAEAVRQSDQRFALVLADSQDQVNTLVAVMKELGYEAFGGTSLTSVTDQVNAGPGVDLIVAAQTPAQINQLVLDSASDYKLAAVPILAVVTAGELIDLNARYENQARVAPTAAEPTAAGLGPAVEQAGRSYAGSAISPEEAEQLALTSLGLLREIGLGSGAVYQAVHAQPALTAAMTDSREPVVEAAAAVLAILPNGEAQRAIADETFNTDRSESTRVALLNSLAESARHLGSQLTEPQLEKILELVKTSAGDLAIAAARAHGALTLPTGNVVPLVAPQ